MINPEKVRARLLKECPRGARTGRVQEIAKDLGISPVVVTQHKQGSKPISKYALAMYHYYFLSIDSRIVDSDIATVEVLHDLLLDVHSYSLESKPLKRARQLTAKMYELTGVKA